MKTFKALLLTVFIQLNAVTYSLAEEPQGRNWISGLSLCGCQDCTWKVYNSFAGDHTCGARIQDLIFREKLTEEAACIRVAGSEHPTTCGPACDPNRCDGRENDPPPIPVSSVNAPVSEVVPSLCDCPLCTPKTWNQLAGYYTCGSRIEWLQNAAGYDQRAACYAVAAEWPAECGSCNPQTCQVSSAMAAPGPNNAASAQNNVAPGPNNGATEQNNAAPDPIPTAAVAASSASASTSNNPRCGCPLCTETTLSANADGHTCEARIDFLRNAFPNLYPRDDDACRQIAHIEFPNQCGPQCDPDRCHNTGNPHTAYTATVAHNNNGGARDMDLYCFRPRDSRETYENVWGKYTVQVKSDAQGKPCGPGDNVFTNKTVSLSDNGRSLKLQFKNVGGQWMGSEVRILLPEAQMPYAYGSYTFSVKSIKVKDKGNVISTVLPQSLVLGLFTWDPTEDYATHENMNHEVDVEISRWNTPGSADAQFLVQPPGNPQTHRFFTGTDGQSYEQAPRIYGFDWRPTEVEWYSSAGRGGERFVYSSQDALDAGQPDYNQCLPANVEVRINLWNVFGTDTPTDMVDGQIAEVVIDNFQFQPNGLTAALEGNVCTKDCQCAESARCIRNQCTTVNGVSKNGGTRRRRELAGDDGAIGDSPRPIAAAPILMVLLLLNALLAVIAIRRYFLAASEPSDLPSLKSSCDEKMSTTTSVDSINDSVKSVPRSSCQVAYA